MLPSSGGAEVCNNAMEDKIGNLPILASTVQSGTRCVSPIRELAILVLRAPAPISSGAHCTFPVPSAAHCTIYRKLTICTIVHAVHQVIPVKLYMSSATSKRGYITYLGGRTQARIRSNRCSFAYNALPSAIPCANGGA